MRSIFYRICWVKENELPFRKFLSELVASEDGVATNWSRLFSKTV